MVDGCTAESFNLLFASCVPSSIDRSLPVFSKKLIEWPSWSVFGESVFACGAGVLTVNAKQYAVFLALCTECRDAQLDALAH